MALVIVAVDILTVPARGEESLGAHAQALLGRELVAVLGVVLIKTLVVDGTVLKLGLVKGANEGLDTIDGAKVHYSRPERISSHYTETCRRRDGAIGVIAVLATLLVVTGTREIVGSLRESARTSALSWTGYLHCPASRQSQTFHPCACGIAKAASSCYYQGPCHRW